jgi:hypothetical protein
MSDVPDAELEKRTVRNPNGSLTLSVVIAKKVLSARVPVDPGLHRYTNQRM